MLKAQQVVHRLDLVLGFDLIDEAQEDVLRRQGIAKGAVATFDDKVEEVDEAR